jgi:hypothetical protein
MDAFGLVHQGDGSPATRASRTASLPLRSDGEVTRTSWVRVRETTKEPARWSRALRPSPFVVTSKYLLDRMMSCPMRESLGASIVPEVGLVGLAEVGRKGQACRLIDQSGVSS